MKRSVTPSRRGGSRRSRPDEVGASDPLYRAALAFERDEALAAEMEEWETATIYDGLTHSRRGIWNERARRGA